MQKLLLTCLSLVQIYTIQGAEKYSPLVTNIIYDYDNLHTYVKQENGEAIARLTQNLQIYRDMGRDTKGLSYSKIQSMIYSKYYNYLDHRNEKAVQLLAPLVYVFGYSVFPNLGFYANSQNEDIKEIHSTSVWEVNTISQVPGLMALYLQRATILDLVGSTECEIEGAWPSIPRVTQRRIISEAVHHYNDSCAKNLESNAAKETQDCRKIREALSVLLQQKETFEAIPAENDAPSNNTPPTETVPTT